ncbi:hypothetical protein, partial [Oribacterium sp. NK2B42]|uniref:hypothetical protein n=1 Tax=Oribacterium sp. NK2B42 TaxID=689781 RepID=UPI001A98007E
RLPSLEGSGLKYVSPGGLVSIEDCLPSPEGSGLKFSEQDRYYYQFLSPLTRGEWIELCYLA